MDHVRFDAVVAPLQCCCTKRAVPCRVCCPADAHAGLVHESDGSSQNAAAGIFILFQITGDDSSKDRQTLTKCQGTDEFLTIPDFPPTLMVNILGAPGGVHAGGLDVGIGRRSDPHMGPRWRNCQSTNRFKPGFGLNAPSIGRNSNETAAGNASFNSACPGLIPHKWFHRPSQAPRVAPGQQKGFYNLRVLALRNHQHM